ncbi:molybdenum cofactor guanylyltransferase [Paenibacillus sp. CMAA1364]
MITGVILASGRNSRMHGYNKALLPYKGERLIERQVRIMRSICQEIIVVTPDPTIYTQLSLGDIVYLPDVYASCGPLTGIHAACLRIQTEFAWVMGCDCPILSSEAAQWMVSRLRKSHYAAAIPFIGGIHQMLHGVYRTDVLIHPIIRLIESKQYRLSALLNLIEWLAIEESEWCAQGIPLEFTLDIDTPEQYLRLLSE